MKTTFVTLASCAALLTLAYSGCSEPTIGQTSVSTRSAVGVGAMVKDLPEKANIKFGDQELAVTKTFNQVEGIVKQIAGSWTIETMTNGQTADRVLVNNLEKRFQVADLKVTFSGYAGAPPPNVRMAGSPFELIEIKETEVKKANQAKPQMEIATFGAGCFWCVEAVFQELDGVTKVSSGYCNGKVENPTYEAVCSGTTGHAEVCRIEFDPSKITFKELLEVFWKTHDPTTLNQQGPDRGTQYRSGVFYHNDEQRSLAEKYKKQLNDENAFRKPVVTEVTKIANYHPAEDYHQNYYKNNPNQGYCRAVIVPKMEKFKKAFGHKLKGATQPTPSDK